MQISRYVWVHTNTDICMGPCTVLVCMLLPCMFGACQRHFIQKASRLFGGLGHCVACCLLEDPKYLLVYSRDRQLFRVQSFGCSGTVESFESHDVSLRKISQASCVTAEPHSKLNEQTSWPPCVSIRLSGLAGFCREYNLSYHNMHLYTK